VVCSHPLYSGEEKLRVSPLIENLPAVGDGTQPPETAVRTMFFAASVLDRQPIGDAPPLSADVEQSGGMRVLEDQAACPFRAFAIHRLAARELDAPELGVSPRERGSVAHAALEILWRELKSQQQLKALSPAEVSGLIQSSVRAALDRTLHRRKKGAIEQFRVLEEDRLERLLESWLEKEKERAPFEVAELEISTAVELGGLKLRIKADRVDRESSGAHAILDYKTAKELSLAGWDGDRPDSPQLPLYAVMSGYPVSKIFFAQLAAGKIGFLPPEGADVEKRGPEWKRILERLAADFVEGRADVDPKVPKKTCELCRLQSLCRIGEIRRVEAEDLDE
jgi:RecB family exonuclease